MSQSIPLRRRIRAKVIVALLRFFARFSLKNLYRLSNFIALFAIYLPNQTRDIAEKNIALAFPELSKNEQKKLLHKTLKHNLATMFELSFMWLNSYEKILQSVEKIDLPTDFIEDQKQFEQMIFITPHFGSWELSGLYASSLYPLATLYRPSRLYIDPLIVDGRSKNGAVLVSTTGQGEGVFAPFFGIQTNTIALVSRLANKFKIPAYIVASKRNLKSGNFTIELIKIDDALQSDDTLESITTLNLAIEKEIRKAPEQYLWTYKRFKTAPEGEPDRYL